MKKRSPITKLRIFLEHLESNMFSPLKRTPKVLEQSFPPRDFCEQMIKLCTDKRYISWKHDMDNQQNSNYELTLDGLEFLNGLRKLEIEEQNQKIQGLLVAVNIVLTLATLLTALQGIQFQYKEIFQIALWLVIATISIYSAIKYYS